MLLEATVVVGREAVDTHNRIATIEQLLAEVRPDEPGASSDNVRRHQQPAIWGVGMPTLLKDGVR